MSSRTIRADNCQIIDIFGVVKEYTDPTGSLNTLELRLIKWGTAGRPVYDLRWWKENAEPGYGLTFSLQDLAELGELITHVFDMAGKDN